MKSVLPLNKLLGQLKKLFWIWVAIAVLAAGTVVVSRSRKQSNSGVAKAVVSFSYSGVESGKDPQGNIFDPTEIKSAEVIREAADEIGLGLDDEGINKVRNNIKLVGNITSSAISSVTKHQSVFVSGEPVSTANVESRSYYPTQYTLSFNYAGLGFNDQQGTELLNAILSKYESRFYGLYGYSSSFEHSVKALDYNDYDYAKAVEVLDANLTLLRGYINAIAKTDDSRFTSSETGYSFDDLIDAIDAMKSKDLYRISSYVSVNNMTKSRWELVDYYEYKIKQLEHELEAQNQMLTTLDELIGSYVKTRAVIASYITGENTEGITMAGYEITRHSETYDALIQQRIDCKVEITNINEELTQYRKYAENLREGIGTGSASDVTDMLKAASDKIDELVLLTNKTATDYYRNIHLKQAFSVDNLSSGESKSAIELVKGSVNNIIYWEILILGVYLLCAAVLALLPGELIKRQKKLAEDVGQESEKPKKNSKKR
ncbi:MAG: hypothetical protein J5449_13320 [Oscillospiraceae bacterium]|nr:hypothetical protein [Oscillospiraceae bacterium]